MSPVVVAISIKPITIITPPIPNVARAPIFVKVQDGMRLAMPTMNDNIEKPRPAPDHDQDISSIMYGKATPREAKVAAVTWKNSRLTRAKLIQPRRIVFVGIPAEGVIDIEANVPE